MENWRANQTVVVAAARCLVMIGLLAFGVNGESLHKVGASQGWQPDVNYTQWSSQETFFVKDWLLFRFDKRYYNVLEVNKTSYENCIDRDFIKNVTRGGRDVVQLTEARTYYFLAGGGYCFHQMRVAVNVEEQRNQMLKGAAPAPSPNSGSLIVPSIWCTWIVILANVFRFL